MTRPFSNLYHQSILLAVAFGLSLSTSLATEVAPLSTDDGPLPVTTGDYKLPAGTDSDVLVEHATELWAKVYWPKEMRSTNSTKTYPMIFFLHGNFATCRLLQGPDIVYSSEYTLTGACPEGATVIPNHEGFSYIAKHLASWGYVVVSVNANRGISSLDPALTSQSDPNLILARGRLVLKHIEKWQAWASGEDLPTSLGIAALKGKVDFNQVGLMGHSRGAEGVRAAYNLYAQPKSPWRKKIKNLSIKGIFEIGATDLASQPFNALNTAWLQLLPMCDGDNRDLVGRLPFERMRLSKQEAKMSLKGVYYVWGANHNFFNSEWNVSDSQGCSGGKQLFDSTKNESSEQRFIGLATMSAFFRAFVGANADKKLARNFNPSFAIPAALSDMTRLGRDFILTPDENESIHFTEAVATHSVQFFKIPAKLTQDTVSAVGFSLLFPEHFLLIWNSPKTTIGFEMSRTTNDQINADHYTTLDFRIDRSFGHLIGAHPSSQPPENIRIRLVDNTGKVSRVVRIDSLDKFLTSEGRNGITTVFQTIRIPLEEFQPFPLGDLRKIRFELEPSSPGSLALADIRLSRRVE